jgi:hypothetical protein
VRLAGVRIVHELGQRAPLNARNGRPSSSKLYLTSSERGRKSTCAGRRADLSPPLAFLPDRSAASRPHPAAKRA